MYKKKNRWMILDVSIGLPNAGFWADTTKKNMKFEKNALFQKKILEIAI